MATNYRVKDQVSSTVPADTRIALSVAVTAGAIGTTRPSAGANAAVGAGAYATVTQPTSGVYQFALAEQYYQIVGTSATFLPAFATDGSTSTAAFVMAQPTLHDPTTNSICVNLINASHALVTGATGRILVEVFVKNTISPVSQ